MSNFLLEELNRFGTPEKVKETIALIETSENYEKFLQNYNYIQHLNLGYIGHIVKDYYTSKNFPVATIRPGDYVPGQVQSLSSLSQHKRPPAIGESVPNDIPSDIILNDHTEKIIGTRDGPTIMYSYKRENGGTYNSWKRLHLGGKRKSRRNRKSKKSRKKLRKSNRRR